MHDALPSWDSLSCRRIKADAVDICQFARRATRKLEIALSPVAISTRMEPRRSRLRRTAAAHTLVLRFLQRMQTFVDRRCDRCISRWGRRVNV